MMDNGFVPKRSAAFPAGLRVLVVDDDPTWLKILEKMLKKCSYEVTTCCLATDALDILRKRRDNFDIVISDVNMPDMDGFKLLEHVGLEMNLPVIMMSVDGEISRVMKGVLHGACDYLLKPIRMKELQNIWQHVLRKKIHEVKDIELSEGNEGIQKIRNGSDAFDDSHLLVGGDLTSARKRKDLENFELDDQYYSDSSSAKKARVIWSVDLHQKFVSAVNQIGLDKVGPKKILDLMNVPWLTRENVASHLQKYRLYLSRLQKQGQPSFGATLQPDFSCMGPSSSFGLQSPTSMHQNNATSSSFGYSSNKMLIQEVSQEIQEVNSKAYPPVLPVTKPKNALPVDVLHHLKVDSGSRMALSNSSQPHCTLFEPNISQHHHWGGESPMIQFAQQPKEELELPRYTPGPTPKHHIQEDLMQALPSKVKPRNALYSDSHVRIGSVQAHNITAKIEAFDSMSTCIVPPSTRNQSSDQCGTSNLGTQLQDFIVGSASNVISCPLFQNPGYNENVGLGTLQFPDYFEPELITELPSHLHDGLRFNSDFLFDSIDYPSINEGLFIT